MTFFFAQANCGAYFLVEEDSLNILNNSNIKPREFDVLLFLI